LEEGDALHWLDVMLDLMFADVGLDEHVLDDIQYDVMAEDFGRWFDDPHGSSWTLMEDYLRNHPDLTAPQQAVLWLKVVQGLWRAAPEMTNITNTVMESAAMVFPSRIASILYESMESRHRTNFRFLHGSLALELYERTENRDWLHTAHTQFFQVASGELEGSQLDGLVDALRQYKALIRYLKASLGDQSDIWLKRAREVIALFRHGGTLTEHPAAAVVIAALDVESWLQALEGGSPEDYVGDAERSLDLLEGVEVDARFRLHVRVVLANLFARLDRVQADPAQNFRNQVIRIDNRWVPEVFNPDPEPDSDTDQSSGLEQLQLPVPESAFLEEAVTAGAEAALTFDGEA
jgi:hypothetical protein